MNYYIIPIFVPHLGCPNDCTFCNQKSISGQTKKMTVEEMKNIIEKHLKSFKGSNDNVYKEIAFFGGSFTGIDVEEQNKLLEVAYEYIKDKKIDSIRISTRPDYIDKDTLKRLKKMGVKTIELGVQSTNDYILQKSKRGHTFEDVKKASKLIRRYGFTLGHQMMIGMPESTRLDELNTAKDLIKLKTVTARDVELYDKEAFEKDGKIMIPVSVQAHHSFVDGLHIGQFAEQLQKFLSEC